MKNFIKSIAIATTVVAVATAANAEEVDTSITDRVAPVCELATVIKLSAKATAVCAGTADKMPKLIKSGERFRNVGVGSEFNVLIRNIEAFKSLTES